MLQKKFGVPKSVKLALIVLIIAGGITEVIHILTKQSPGVNLPKNDKTTNFEKYQLVDNFYAKFPIKPTIETKESENILLTIGQCNFELVSYLISIAKVKKIESPLENRSEEIFENGLKEVVKN